MSNTTYDICLFLDNIDKYKSKQYTTKQMVSMNDNMEKRIIRKLRTINIKSIELIILNINILIDKQLSYHKIVDIINRDYPCIKDSKMEVFNVLSKYILNKYKCIGFRFRYGQKEAYDIFKHKLTKSNYYWGLLIAL